MDFPHPFRVTLGKIVVHRNDMHALARKCVEICGQGRNEGLTFTRTHFCDTALMQANTADDLHAEMAHTEHALCRLAKRSERVEENIVEGFTLGKAVFQDRRLAFERFVVHRLIFRL